MKHMITFESHSEPFRMMTQREAADLDRKLRSVSVMISAEDDTTPPPVDSLFDCPGIQRVTKGAALLGTLAEGGEVKYHVYKPKVGEIYFRASEEEAAAVIDTGGCITGFDIMWDSPEHRVFQIQYLVDDWVYVSYAVGTDFGEYMCDGDHGLSALVGHFRTSTVW
jgi:hypothetical protein